MASGRRVHKSDDLFADKGYPRGPESPNLELATNFSVQANSNCFIPNTGHCLVWNMRDVVKGVIHTEQAVHR